MNGRVGSGDPVPSSTCRCRPKVVNKHHKAVGRTCSGNLNIGDDRVDLTGSL